MTKHEPYIKPATHKEEQRHYLGSISTKTTFQLKPVNHMGSFESAQLGANKGAKLIILSTCPFRLSDLIELHSWS